MTENKTCKWCNRDLSEHPDPTRHEERCPKKPIWEKGNFKFGCVKCKRLIYHHQYALHTDVCRTESCAQCSVEFVVTHDTKRFCSKSCAATFNNLKKSTESRTKQGESLKERYRLGLRTVKEKSEYCKFSYCIICKEVLHNKHKKLCSLDCRKKLSSINGRKSASKRIKRSKDEIKLFDLCISEFANVTHNVPIKDGWDADVILNDHKVAIL